MASSTEDMRFRRVRMGAGATLSITGDPPSRIGAYPIITCVGVYFRVDKERCFFAFMDCRSPETYEDNVVTPEAGEVIVEQVKRILRGALQIDKWDIINAEFGRNVILQSPQFKDLVHDGVRYTRVAKYIVQGVQGFFSACSQALKDEVEAMENRPKTTSAGRHNSKVKRLIRKTTEFDQIGRNVEVNSTHRVLIVEPSTGQSWRLGKVTGPGAIPATGALEKLEGHIPYPRPDLPLTCLFGPVEDNRSSFHQDLLTNDESRVAIVNINTEALKQHHLHCDEAWDATSQGASHYLDGAIHRDGDYFFSASSGEEDAPSDDDGDVFHDTFDGNAVS